MLTISRVISDIIVILFTAILYILLEQFLPPIKRGFFVDDSSISYSYNSSPTVPTVTIICLGISITFLCIILTELFRKIVWEKKTNLVEFYKLKKFTVNAIFIRLYIFIGYFTFGVICNQLMVQIAKASVGRLRPYFLNVCEPAFLNGTRIYFNAHNHIYISSNAFICTNKDSYRVRESKFSFYSGHTAFSFYAATYLSLYLQARFFQPLASSLVIPTLQFLLFGGAFFVGYTRVSDFHHHWSDVIVGIFIGTIIGGVNAIYWANIFSRREIPNNFVRKHVLNNSLETIEFKSNLATNIGNDNNEPNSIYMKRMNENSDVNKKTIILIK